MSEYRFGFADGIAFSLVLICTAVALTILFYPAPPIFAVVRPTDAKPAKEPKEEITEE